GIIGKNGWKEVGDEDLSKTKLEIETALNAPVVVPSKELAPVTVSEADLKAAGLEFSLESDGVHLKGKIPSKCYKDGNIQRLVLGSVKATSPSSPDDSEEAKSLADSADRLSVSANFQGQDVEGMKSLVECKSKAAATDPTVDVDLVSKFSDPENGAILVLDDGSKLKSERLRRLESLIKDCADCSASQHRKKFNEIIGLDSEALDAAAKSHLEALIKQASEAIDEATTLADLEKARNDLMLYAQDASKLKNDRDELRSLVRTQFQRIIDKNEVLAKKSRECAKKSPRSVFEESTSCATAGEYADFAAKTYREAAKLPGLSAQERDGIRNEARKFEEGSLERVKFIANIDPVNDEVTDAIQNGRDDLRAASMDVRRECAFLNPRTFASCNQAKQSYLDLAKTYQDLYQNYSANTYMGQQFQMQSPFGMGGYMGPAQFAPGMSGGFYPMGGFQNAGMNGMMMNSPFMMNGMQQMNSPFMMNGMQQMN
ncbi:MAG: hypothetical protein EBX52_13420, partial [Proteobacteria bacterium]|nr:hypothetical protein [Pseudomonadota bacterium]